MINVGIVGAAGYTGQTLVKILLSHPDVKLTFITSKTYEGKLLSDLDPSLTGSSSLKFEGNDYTALAQKCDTVFLCLPHKESMGAVRTFIDAGKIVFDLSADFRLESAHVYEKWYGVKHTEPDLLGKAVYGLPEIYKNELAKAGIVAVPGCYPTSAILGIAPLLDKNMIDKDTIVIHCVSGVSGAGRKADLMYNLAEIEGNFWAYGAPEHRHTPEIEQEMSNLAGYGVTVTFIPHILPVARGIYTTITARLGKDESASGAAKAYQKFYAGSRFVTVSESFPQMKWAVGSNRAFINVTHDKRSGSIIVSSTIDNLIKGAAGQGVQCFNIRYGLDEGAGL